MDSRTDRTLVDRLVIAVLSPSNRISGLIALAYVSAVAGLALTFVSDLGATDQATSAGLVLMFFAFVLLFYVSVFVSDVRGG